jgi:Family of unknown function (DUF5302)
MAKSAKAPGSPAEPTRSAEAGSPETKAPAAKSPDAELATGEAPDAEAQSGAGSEPAEGAPPAADDLDETKRKFREALDRKKQAHAKDTAAAGNRAAGKAHGAGGPATSRRQFRRKSG